MKKQLMLFGLLAFAGGVSAKQMNVILIMADDLSAREFPFYESTKITGDRRAKTPMMDTMTENGGCFVETAWNLTICKPSRVQMMNGTYAYNHKFWDNKHIGADSHNTYSAYESAPITLGSMSRDAGYANIWVSKTHITTGCDLLSMGFNEMVLNPAESLRHPAWNQFGMTESNPYPHFQSKNPKDWDHDSFFWWPEMQLVNSPKYPNEPYKYIPTELNDYAPDLEMEHIFEFMDRQKKAGKPFFVYHTPHLGHLSKDYANPKNPTVWVGTPEIEWKNGGYVRKDPKHIKQADGSYKLENITPQGVSYHVEYLDYQMWQYVQKLKEMGELENTVIIFMADNGTQDNAGQFGKARIEQQQGMHVPFLVYAPGVKGFKEGRQNIQVDSSDVLPTVAEIMGYKFPENYTKLDGQSVWPYLTGKSNSHKDYIYAMRLDAQMIRNDKVLKDGRGVWYDVNKRPGDFHSFTPLDQIPEGEYKQSLLAEKAKLEKILPKYNLYNTDSEAPLPPKDSDKDGISDAFEAEFGELDPKADLDGDGVNNYLEFIHGGDPKNKKSPTKEQLPHLIEISDAQGKYLALKFDRRSDLGPNYWFKVEGSRDGGKTWATDGVMQQSSRVDNGDGSETMIARVAADKSKSGIKNLRLTVVKPLPIKPRKYENLVTKKPVTAKKGKK